MAISRTKKEAVIEQLRSIFADAKTIVFVQFDKVTSEEANTLRGVCVDEEVGYLVAKKTLIRKAFDDSSLAGVLPAMEGEIALAYGDDMLAPARVMGEQSKALDERLTIVGGVFENALVSQEEMRSIAAIPPLETLYAQFLMVIRAPVQGLASVLGQIADTKA
ncbi:MAG: 50S ribosomal protein L10 [Candidatus Kaiserbacteria bacterium]|nr:50S ribosomal protein L10 [Candidatus Kaiserbacteria bacterium]